ncbi:hypothetical protein U4960_03105 [Altererythrobacter sp. H2]|uniref:hypothetical protein n=1 Tax=Altererythrobacter sp. H2 TaxID=3108391 RepID=UPI002B4BA7A2|nr:hypothetical protein [Altererythrobacter sp. H2]WRK96337.1 hypothetical protein U4960_03105 [Altererythrobacter sp. H2]
MIRARSTLSPSAFAQRLARKAARLAEARAGASLLARREDPRRWRMARLLWPLFTSKD